MRSGDELRLMADHVGAAQVAPDGAGYAVRLPEPDVSEITSFDENGVRPGWPARIEGFVSLPGFRPDGEIVVAVSPPGRAPTQLIVLDANGQVTAESASIPVASPPDWTGAGADLLGSLAVGSGGLTWLVGSTGDGTESIWALNADGEVVDSWPWTPPGGLVYEGACGARDTGCGEARVTPAVNAGNGLVVATGPADDAKGGAVVALTSDGRAGDGWPVTLNRPGSEFWGLETDDTGMSYALAIEPEDGGAHSATVIAIEPDSTIRYASTIVEP